MHLEAHVAVKKAGLTEARGNATEDDIKRFALFSLVDRHIMRKLARQPQPLDTDQNPRKLTFAEMWTYLEQEICAVSKTEMTLRAVATLRTAIERPPPSVRAAKNIIDEVCNTLRQANPQFDLREIGAGELATGLLVAIINDPIIRKQLGGHELDGHRSDAPSPFAPPT